MKKTFLVLMLSFLLVSLGIAANKLFDEVLKENIEKSVEVKVENQELSVDENIHTGIILESQDIQNELLNDIEEYKDYPINENIHTGITLENEIYRKIEQDKEKKQTLVNGNCEEEPIESIYGEYNFPSPIKTNLIFENKNSKCPSNNNYRRIIIPKNTSLYRDYITFTGKDGFNLTGKILNDVEKIEIIWNGDMDSYFLNEYIPGNSDFSYNISKSYGNLKTGMNRYLIRGYSKKGFYEEVFNLLYIDYNDTYSLNKVNSVIFHGDYDIKPSFGYIIEENKYNLGMYYGTYKLSLEKFDIIFSNNVDKEKSYIKIIDKINGNEYLDNSYEGFISGDFSTPKVEILENNHIIFSISGHESAIQEIIFNYNTKKFYEVFNLIKENVETSNLYHLLKIEDGFLYIDSSLNPWVEGSYNLKFDFNTMKIIK